MEFPSYEIKKRNKYQKTIPYSFNLSYNVEMLLRQNFIELHKYKNIGRFII